MLSLMSKMKYKSSAVRVETKMKSGLGAPVVTGIVGDNVGRDVGDLVGIDEGVLDGWKEGRLVLGE